jgi:ABC-type spermidine/putrescine transport system permease subunit I
MPPSAPGIGGPSLSARRAKFIVFTYIWLPYMIADLSALERPLVPEASADLGARPADFLTVICCCGPGIAADRSSPFR